MKKAQMLKFLFWTIVGLAFFIPACVIINKGVPKLGDNSIASYTKLIETAESTGENEVASLAFSLNKKSVVVGFSKNTGQFENWKGNDKKSIYVKPVAENGCAAGKACICICQGYELDKKTNPKSAKPCELLICHAFESIDIISEKDVNTDEYVSTGYKWKGGFLIHRDISDSEDVNGLEKNNIGTRTFYVQRINDVVGVCTISTHIAPCVP
ncbi:MAG: hypothetical protein AABX74_00390 [Nanoarchaeota archaeon]